MPPIRKLRQQEQPEIGAPYQPGLLPQWQMYIDQRIESIKTRTRAFERDWELNLMDTRERDGRIADIWTDVQWLKSSTRAVAKSRGEWLDLIEGLRDAFRDATTFVEKCMAVVETCENWLIVRGYIFTSEALGVNWAKELQEQIDNDITRNDERKVAEYDLAHPKPKPDTHALDD